MEQRIAVNGSGIIQSEKSVQGVERQLHKEGVGAKHCHFFPLRR